MDNKRYESDVERCDKQSCCCNVWVDTERRERNCTVQYCTKLSSNWGDFRIVLCHNKAAYSCIITNCFDSVFNDSSPRPHRRATVLYPPNIETFSRAFLEFCVVFDLSVKYEASCEANVLVLCSVSIVLERYDSAVYYLPLRSNKLITFSWSLSQV